MEKIVIDVAKLLSPELVSAEQADMLLDKVKEIEESGNYTIVKDMNGVRVVTEEFAEQYLKKEHILWGFRGEGKYKLEEKAISALIKNYGDYYIVKLPYTIFKEEEFKNESSSPESTVKRVKKEVGHAFREVVVTHVEDIAKKHKDSFLCTDPESSRILSTVILHVRIYLLVCMEMSVVEKVLKKGAFTLRVIKGREFEDLRKQAVELAKEMGETKDMFIFAYIRRYSSFGEVAKLVKILTENCKDDCGLGHFTPTDEDRDTELIVAYSK